MKRSLIRVAITGALTAPVLFMASGVASADGSSYCTERSYAGPHGAYTERTCSKGHADDKDSKRHGGKDGHGKDEYGKGGHGKGGHGKGGHGKGGHGKDEYGKGGHGKDEYGKGYFGYELLGGLLGL
ncbi:hypothetical protein [Streptomyces venetus]|uniref:hypothetical protein n=1 Tax=Streptomyces venetus TaxID=1701086 RepID=UPI003C30D637